MNWCSRWSSWKEERNKSVTAHSGSSLLETPTSALKLQMVTMLFTFFGSPLLRVQRGVVPDSLLSCFHAQVVPQSLTSDPFLVLMCTVVVSRGDCALHDYLSFISDSVTILPYVCQPFQCCVQGNVHVGLFWQGFSLKVVDNNWYHQGKWKSGDVVLYYFSNYKIWVYRLLYMTF